LESSALFEAFDSIDLMSIQEASAVDAAVKKMGRVQAMADRIHTELKHLLPEKTGGPTVARNRIALSDDQNVVEFPTGHPAPDSDEFQLGLRRRSCQIDFGRRQ
jgi:hypothetical protein